MYNTRSVNAIVKDQVFLGNLSAAQSNELRKRLGITHILSVCPEFPSTGSNHLTIDVQDSEYEDLLIHLPRACQFIQHAVDIGGKVLVHCVMGISRSTTVVCAYLMKSRHLSPSAALRLVKRWRPQVHPNYGFMRQLHTFAECQYEPSPTSKAYISWKRNQQHQVTKFLKTVVDTIPIVPDRIYLSSDFPIDAEQAESLLLDLGITHLLSLSPADITSAVVKHRHISLDNTKESLLVALPDACRFISEALDEGGQVLVHCLIESRACTVVCAHLMASDNISPSNAVSQLEDALPLFNPTSNFMRHLELLDACKHRPTSDHPLVKEWVDSEKESPSSDANRSPVAISATAASVLSETGFDVAAFGETLARIQTSVRA